MKKEQIEKRIEEIKKENDSINQRFQQIEQEKSQLINQAMMNNGRIEELNKMLENTK